jgi:ribosomal protein S18 acetylase RimI-like enzyme
VTQDVPTGSAPASIRRATSGDADQVFLLSRAMATTAVVDHGLFDAAFVQLLPRDDAVVLVAVESPPADDSAIVGYLLGFDHLAFFANGRVSYVEEVAVREDRQGQKIGLALMRAFEAWAASRASVMVTVATRRAQAFYRATGYEESATFFRKLL